MTTILFAALVLMNIVKSVVEFYIEATAYIGIHWSFVYNPEKGLILRLLPAWNPWRWFCQVATWKIDLEWSLMQRIGKFYSESEINDFSAVLLIALIEVVTLVGILAL